MLRRAIECCCPVAPSIDSCVTVGHKSPTCTYLHELPALAWKEQWLQSYWAEALGALWELTYVSSNLSRLLIFTVSLIFTMEVVRMLKQAKITCVGFSKCGDASFSLSKDLTS